MGSNIEIAYNRDFARRIMSNPNNSVITYLRHIIQNRLFNAVYGFEAMERQRTKLHCKVLVEFGFDPNNDSQYERSKHILGNIDKILQYYLPTQSTIDISTGLTASFFNMLDSGLVISEKDLDDIQRFVCMFLVEKDTRKFIEGNLKPYNDINEYEYVFISNLHDYYNRKSYERNLRKKFIEEDDK